MRSGGGATRAIWHERRNSTLGVVFVIVLAACNGSATTTTSNQIASSTGLTTTQPIDDVEKELKKSDDLSLSQQEKKVLASKLSGMENFSLPAMRSAYYGEGWSTLLG